MNYFVARMQCVDDIREFEETYPADLAVGAALSRSTLSRMRRGLTVPRTDLIGTIATFYGCELRVSPQQDERWVALFSDLLEGREPVGISDLHASLKTLGISDDPLAVFNHVIQRSDFGARSAVPVWTDATSDDLVALVDMLHPQWLASGALAISETGRGFFSGSPVFYTACLDGSPRSMPLYEEWTGDNLVWLLLLDGATSRGAQILGPSERYAGIGRTLVDLAVSGNVDGAASCLKDLLRRGQENSPTDDIDARSYSGLVKELRITTP